MSVEFGNEQGAGTESVETTGPSTETINPAWEEALSGVPDAFRSQLTPHFKKWDEGVNERFQRQAEVYKPYQPFIDQKVDPQRLNASYQLLQQLQSDPQAVYQQLGEHLGISAQEAEELVNEDNGTEEWVDPRLDEVAQRQEEMQQWMQQEQQKQVTEVATRQANADVDALVEKYNLPRGPVLGSILGRAINNHNGDLEAGYQEEMRYQQYLAQNNPNNSAPRVLSASGSSGSAPAVDVTALSDSERKAYLVRQVMAANGQ